MSFYLLLTQLRQCSRRRMPRNSWNASPKRDNFLRRENSLPTYKEATEKVQQQTVLEELATGSTSVCDAQNNSFNNERIVNNLRSLDETTKTQIFPKDQDLGQCLQMPTMIQFGNVRVWNAGRLASTNCRDFRLVEKQSTLGFHIVGYLIVIMIILILIVLIVKSIKTWVIVE